MPEGYIGDPQEDLALIAQVNDLAKMLGNDGKKKLWMVGLETDRTLVKSYIDWQNFGH